MNDPVLKRAFAVLHEWIPFTAEDYGSLLARSTAADRAYYRKEEKNGLTYCVFSWPLYKADNVPFRLKDDAPGAAVSEQWVLLVFNAEDEVVADLAAEGMPLWELRKDCVRSRLEEESDWLYWQTEIVLDSAEHDPPDAEVLLYTNAYTSKRYRGKHILTHMLKMTEEAVLSRRENAVLLSCISLDPDVACYGEDRTDAPYIYSMKDEPARLRNAEILKHLGWQPIRLMTDEPVEDGAILWFAFHRTACVTV
ncbi:MAG: hypothetical protein IKG46_02875 [Solobacterium sp.]|nr:hypothetical protein [Solobacterium sp.]